MGWQAWVTDRAALIGILFVPRIGDEPAWTAPPSPPREGDKTGPNPADTGRLGTKRQPIVDRNGLPFAFVLTAYLVTLGWSSDTIRPAAAERLVQRHQVLLLGKVEGDECQLR